MLEILFFGSLVLACLFWAASHDKHELILQKIQKDLVSLSGRVSALESKLIKEHEVDLLQGEEKAKTKEKEDEAEEEAEEEPSIEKIFTVFQEKLLDTEDKAPEHITRTPTAAQNWEESIGKDWLTYAGGILLTCAVIFCVKWAYDQGLIGPMTQEIFGMAIGLFIILVGHRWILHGLLVFGQVVVAIGLSILYASFFAGYALYENAVFTQTCAFIGMIFVTCLGILVAVRHNAVLITAFSVVGAFLTPVLLSSGEDKRDTLFLYLLLIDLGVLVVSWLRDWRGLDFLTLSGTIGLFVGWMLQHYDTWSYPNGLPAHNVFLWCMTFYVVFLFIPFLHSLHTERRVTVEKFVSSIANAAFAYLVACFLYIPSNYWVPGILALGMSIVYLIMEIVANRCIPGDKLAELGFTLLSATSAAMVPLMICGLHGITIVWALEAPVLLWHGYRSSQTLLKIGSGCLLMLTISRVFLVHLQPHYAHPFLNVHFLTSLMAPFSAFFMSMIHSLEKTQEDGDMNKHNLPDRLCFVAGFIVLWLITEFEANNWVDYAPPRIAVVLCISWVFNALIWQLSIVLFKRKDYCFESHFSVIPIFVAMVHTNDGFSRLIPEDPYLFLHVAFVTSTACFGLLILSTRFMKRESVRIFFWIVGGIYFYYVVSWEVSERVDKYSEHWPATASSLVFVSLTFALCFIMYGHWKASAALRRTAVLFLLVSFIDCGAFFYEWKLQPFSDFHIVPIFLNSAVYFVWAFLSPSKNHKVIIACCGGCFTLILHAMEVKYALLHSGTTPYAYEGGVAVSAIYMTCGVFLLWKGLKQRSEDMCRIAFFILLIGTISSGLMYSIQTSIMVVLNARFFVSLLGSLALAYAGWCFGKLDEFSVHSRKEDHHSRNERSLSVNCILSYAFYALGLIVLFAFSTMEPMANGFDGILDGSDRSMKALVSISIIWSTFSAILLAVGFIWKWKSLRFVSLFWFFITCIKVVLLDLAHAHQAYRISSLMALGVLMMGGSFLYHSFEKRLYQFQSVALQEEQRE